MFASRHLLALAAVLVLGLGSGGCTLVKPVIGAFSGPVMMLGNSDSWTSDCGNPQGILCALTVMAAVGAGAGLVTGMISDVRYVCGWADDPTNNWWDPFKLNIEDR
ncbi:MAG TPA: hypothetical protein VF384_02020 [Planctomycetota bacterium]